MLKSLLPYVHMKNRVGKATPSTASYRFLSAPRSSIYRLTDGTMGDEILASKTAANDEAT